MDLKTLERASAVRFGAFVLRPARRELWRDGAPVPLGGRAFDLLVTLLAHRDRVMDRAELLDRVWADVAVEPNNLQVQIWSLRQLLGADQIVTVPRRGYRYVGPAPQAVPSIGGPVPRTRPGESDRVQLRWNTRSR